MLSILSNLDLYGSPSDLESELESDHRWVAIINEVNHKGFLF
jgi:hypothetical protein